MTSRDTRKTVTASPPPAKRYRAQVVPKAERYRQAADLLRQWMMEDDGYDGRVWPLLEETLQEPLRLPGHLSRFVTSYRWQEVPLAAPRR